MFLFVAFSVLDIKYVALVVSLLCQDSWAYRPSSQPRSALDYLPGVMPLQFHVRVSYESDIV